VHGFPDPLRRRMYNNLGANLAVVLATFLAVAAVVLIHYEGLILVSRLLARHNALKRGKLLIGIASVLSLHIAEIWVFGVTVWGLLHWPDCGQVLGTTSGHLLDSVYFSAVIFSTLGLGDIMPVGPLRFLVGTEAITGFVLVTWSASFTYLEMERFWRFRP